MHRNFNDLKTETMELKEKIEHYTHYITDQSENKWKVIETSDLEDLMESYHQAKLKLLGIYGVMRSFLNRKSKEFNIPVDELYLQLYRDNEILLLKDEDYGSGIEVLQEIEI